MNTLVTVYMDNKLDVVFDKYKTDKTIPQIVEEVETKTSNWVHITLNDLNSKAVKYIGFERKQWFK